MVKLVETVLVKNSMGLHTRPATMIVKLLQNCQSQVHFIYKKEEINAKSILSLLMLGARKNSKIKVKVEGEDAETVMQNLIRLFDEQFGEVITNA